MLLNLSNHPSAQWPEKQKNRANQQFGEIADLPFPVIDPEIDENKIVNLAHKYAEKCLQQFNIPVKQQFNIPVKQQLRNAVHIMGELTFCFALVNILQKKGIKCIASTTKRNVVQNGLTKTSGFSFVRFREYQKI